ncbi:hypothetical protein NEOKW01_1078 [Nematocida sp. AWRm80]|nr:hypothetical protein NEOKW01_1078 [Nematocida sp. AWRm80]
MPGVVKIHQIDRRITPTIIRQFFSRFGEIKRITLPRRNETDALVEYTTKTDAKRAIKELDQTTLSDIRGRTTRNKNTPKEFIWTLSLQSTDDLWNEDPLDRVRLEKAIVQNKRKNLLYIESVGKEIELQENPRQRQPVSQITYTANKPSTNPSQSQRENQS